MALLGQIAVKPIATGTRRINKAAGCGLGAHRSAQRSDVTLARADGAQKDHIGSGIVGHGSDRDGLLCTSIPTSTVVDGGMAARRVRVQAFACGGTGCRPAHPRESRRAADPSEVMMSRCLSIALLEGDPYPGYTVARMRYEIILAPEAIEDLRRLRANIRSAVHGALETHLRYTPTKTSKSRIKRLRGLSRPPSATRKPAADRDGSAAAIGKPR
jgi:hypothetical protein